MWKQKNNNMNKEKVLEIINDVINDRLSQMLEDMSTNQFVDMICDKYQSITGETIEESNSIVVDDVEYCVHDEKEEVVELIGSRVVPLMGKISEYVLGVDFLNEVSKDLK